MADRQVKDRRQQERHSVSFPVEYSGEVAGSGQAGDLSTLGCSVVTDISIPVKSYVKLQLWLPDEAKPLEIDLAVVRWSHGENFGVEFIAFGEVQKTRLKRFLNSVALPGLST